MNTLSSAVVLCALVSGCATAPDTLREADTLLQRDREWAAVAAQGRDVDLIVSFWADDATIVPPDAGPVHGKAAIRDYVKRSLAIPGFHIEWRPTNAATSADGSLGYTVGENRVIVPGPNGKPITIAGRYATVWQRMQGGEWKCVVDIWNSAP